MSQACKLGAGLVSQRLQTRTYQGQPSTALRVTNYAYVLSDTVPADKFWALFYASAIITGGAGTAVNRVGLWLIIPGLLPAGNKTAYSANDTFFQGSSATITNGPPVGPRAIRVDEANDGLSSDEYAVNAERVMVRARKLLVPSGCTLMAYGGGYGNGNGGANGEQFQLQITFVEFQNSENPDVEF
jgi:hypothetical protein